MKKRLCPLKFLKIKFVKNCSLYRCSNNFYFSIKKRIFKAIETGVKVFKNRSNRIPTRKLNDFLLPIIESHPPPSSKGKFIKIKFCTQLPSPYPQFVFFCNLPQYVKDSYKRFLEKKKIREKYDYNGLPFQLYFRKNNHNFSLHNKSALAFPIFE